MINQSAFLLFLNNSLQEAGTKLNSLSYPGTFNEITDDVLHRAKFKFYELSCISRAWSSYELVKVFDLSSIQNFLQEEFVKLNGALQLLESSPTENVSMQSAVNLLRHDWGGESEKWQGTPYFQAGWGHTNLDHLYSDKSWIRSGNISFLSNRFVQIFLFMRDLETQGTWDEVIRRDTLMKLSEMDKNPKIASKYFEPIFYYQPDRPAFGNFGITTDLELKRAFIQKAYFDCDIDWSQLEWRALLFYLAAIYDGFDESLYLFSEYFPSVKEYILTNFPQDSWWRLGGLIRQIRESEIQLSNSYALFEKELRNGQSASS